MPNKNLKSSHDNNPLQLLVQLLADGQWHSGQELANTIGVSRTAVWKQLTKLNELGLYVKSLKGKGYRLHYSLDLLDGKKIKKQLTSQAQNYFLEPELFFVTDSTNTRALKILQAGYACLSEMQTAGRGRRSRDWITPLASQITLSVVAQFDAGVSAISGLSLVVGLCVVRAIKKLAPQHSELEHLKLKWPNDILYRNKKIGGILMEVGGDFAGPCQVVIGLGLNVSMPALSDHGSEDVVGAKNVKQNNRIAERDNKTDKLNNEALIDQAYSDLNNILGYAPDRNILSALIINELAEVLSDYAQTGFAYYQQQWLELDAYYQQAVNITLGAQEISGIAQGVDEAAQLLVKTENGIECFNGGEVSLRLKH